MRGITIETKVLGKGLGEDDLVAIVHKVPHSKGILVRAPTGESLVGHVKEDQQLTVLQNPGESKGGKSHPKKKKKEETGLFSKAMISKRDRMRGGKRGTLANLEISFHCSWEGSTPVGLWAQAWRRTMDFLGAALRSSIRPLKSSPQVLGS